MVGIASAIVAEVPSPRTAASDREGRMRSIGVFAALALLATTGCSPSLRFGDLSVTQCQAPPHLQAPPAAALEPVWRTYGDARDGFSLALPVSWDGLVIGSPDPQEAAGRSPWLRDALASITAGVTPDTKFVATGVPGSPDLFVRMGRLTTVATLDCLLTVISDQTRKKAGLEASIKSGRVHFPASDANETVYATRDTVNGHEVEYADFDFALLLRSSHQYAELQFAAPKAEGDQYEPLFWRIAESFSLGKPASNAAGRTCMYTVPKQPDSRLVAGKSCPVPLGAEVFRVDCVGVANTSMIPVDSQSYDPKTGKNGGDARIDVAEASCPTTLPVGYGVFVKPRPAGPANAVLAVDFRLTSSARTYIGLVVRQAADSELRAGFDWGGEVEIRQTNPGTNGLLASGYHKPTQKDVHRLILAVAGSQAQAWVDGSQAGPLPTIIAARQGGVQVYFANQDTSATATLEMLRFVVYENPASDSPH